jgi:sterol 3beta-glucosyltransferase
LKVLLITIGSRGDVQPYVALGKGLAAAGHQVTVCTNAHFADFVRAHGLHYGPMNNGFVDLITSLEGRAGLERMTSLPGTLRTVARLLPRIGPLQRETLDDAWVCAQASRPDLILFHPKLPGAVDMADALGVPAIMAPLFPQVMPTSAFPAVGFPPLPLGDGYRRLTYRIVEALTNRLGSGPIHAWRRSQGLGKRPPKLGMLSDRQGSPIPVLHGFSSAVCPRPADWPEAALTCGFWTLDAAPDWTPPPALRDFLDAGPPPVYVGFGSMAGRDSERLGALVLEALARSGCRGIVATGWGGMKQQALPERVFALSEAPHEWLFPRVAAVVHHGGAGTTAAGLRAGKPSVICPFFADQPFWGRQVHRLDAGPEPIAQKRLTSQRLALAIKHAVTAPALSQAARNIQRELQAERAIDTTVAWIERWMGSR